MVPARVTRHSSSTASPSVDMLALGFGVVSLDSVEDMTNQLDKVSEMVCDKLFEI